MSMFLRGPMACAFVLEISGSWVRVQMVPNDNLFNMKTSVHLLNPHYTQTVQHRESHNIIRSLPT